MRRLRVVLLVLCTVPSGGLLARAPEPPPVRGLDHVIVAVRDLDAAAARYRELGFTLKPGRPHPNGIRNFHAKFPDGTEIELITAPEARDALTAKYRRHLEAGDGPAFAALFAPDREALAQTLDLAGLDPVRSGALVTFAPDSRLRGFFFGGRNASPTDRPEHFDHPNRASALIAVWMAGDEPAYRELLAAAGACLERVEVHLPDATDALVARFPEGEVVLLPPSEQLVSGRPVVGATVETSDLDAARAALARSGLPVPEIVPTPRGRSLFIPEELTHGLRLELREVVP